MSYTEFVNCDLCGKKISEQKSLKRGWSYSVAQQSTYSLELKSKKTDRRLDLCHSCFYKCLKKINWNEVEKK